MKTIYDYNITKNELGYLLVKIPEKEYLKVSTKQKKISDLYCLFRLRNDFENMEKIEKSIQEGLY